MHSVVVVCIGTFCYKHTSGHLSEQLQLVCALTTYTSQRLLAGHCQEGLLVTVTRFVQIIATIDTVQPTCHCHICLLWMMMQQLW